MKGTTTGGKGIAAPRGYSHLTRLLALAVLGILGVALYGCGSDAGTPSAIVAETQTQTQAQTQPATSVPVPTDAATTPSATPWVPPTALAGTPIPGAIATLTAAPPLKTGTLTITNKQGEMINMTVEIADTEASRELGLMHRSQMDPDAGMLFSWTEDTEGGFWMYNTILPLSIAFFTADGTILNVADMQPLDTNTTPAAGSYRYALETNQGFFKAHNITAGDKVTLPGQQSVVIPGMPSCCCVTSAASP